MTEAEYVFCKWKGRLWPAKVLSGSPSWGKRCRLKGGTASVCVEIFALREQANVSRAAVQPLKKETIEDIAAKLAQSKQSRRHAERELTYRKALREALDLLDSALGEKDAPERAWAPPAAAAEAPERAEGHEAGDAPPAAVLAAVGNEHVSDRADSPCAVPSGGKRLGAVDADTTPVSGCSAASPPPAPPSRNALAGVGEKSPSDSPADGRSAEDGEATRKRPGSASDDARNPLNGTPLQNRPAQKKRHWLCPEGSDPEPLPAAPASEWEGERSWTLNGEPSKLPRAGAGPESGSDLSPSPVRERSSSPSSSSEEEEELPSFFLPQELGSIEEGQLVWCKVRGYPYWPAVVKNLKRKAKKASVLFVENGIENKVKGFSVPLRNLKHFDCEEKAALINAAQEKHKHHVDWCVNLIEDYRIRVGCNSFTGSFLEYCSDAMSLPVRNEGLPHLPPMDFPSVEEEGEGEEEGRGGPSASEPASPKRAKKLLPDRTRAARDKANQKLVDFIVKAQGAEGHLQAVLRRQKPSGWMARFRPGRRQLAYIETYLEDDAQQDQVLHYLEGVFHRTEGKILPERCRDRVSFILDVLFPEAIIYAIAAVDHIEYQKAEEKYTKGPPVSQRERHLFEERIWEELRAKKQQQSKEEEEEEEESL